MDEHISFCYQLKNALKGDPNIRIFETTDEYTIFNFHSSVNFRESMQFRTDWSR